MNKEEKIKKALLKDFKELLKPEFTDNWKSERFLIEMYLKVMRLDNLMKIVCEENKELEQIIDTAIRYIDCEGYDVYFKDDDKEKTLLQILKGEYE